MQKPALTFFAIVLGALGVVLWQSVFTVHQREQAIVMQFGEPKRIVQEPGLKFKLPFVQDVTYMDKRVLAFDARPEEVIASDQKRLVVDSFARFRIADPLKFYQTVGNLGNARERLNSVINSSLRLVLGKAELQHIVSGERAALMAQIRDLVNGQAKDLGLEIVDVRIRRADLPEANSQAIFRRMQTAREREAREIRAKGAEISQRIRADADKQKVVLVAEAKRKAAILRGQGDAEKNRIFAKAFGKDPEFFAFYRSMQAYRASMKDADTSMVLSPDSEFFRYFRDVEGAGAKK